MSSQTAASTGALRRRGSGEDMELIGRSRDGLADGVTGVILAGGESRRMGSNKALLPYRGGRFIEAVRSRLYGLFDEVLVVTNTPEHYRFLGGRLVRDIHVGMGVLGGLHAGLAQSRTSHIFAVACDMPCLNVALIKALTALRHRADVVIPEGEGGLEPLHAVYGQGCLPHMEASLAENRRRIVSFFPKVEVARFGKDRVAAIAPGFDSFRNVNTPEDYFALRGSEAFPADETTPARCGRPHARQGRPPGENP